MPVSTRARRKLTFAALVGLAAWLGFVAAGHAQEPQTLPEPQHDPAEVRDLADEILAREEFRRPAPSAIERAQQWLAERIARLLEDLVGGGGNALSWLMLLAAAGALVWFVARAARGVQADPSRAARLTIERRRTAAEWRAEADAQEAAGQWKAALRSRYRALVTDLVERDLLKDVAGRTSGEYRAEVGRVLPAASGAFNGATELFERAWYGDRPTGPAERDRFRELADSVVSVTRSRVGV